MTHQEILTKAVEKAKDNGFKLLGDHEVKLRKGYLLDKDKIVEEPYVVQYRGSDSFLYREISYQVVIFNRDFAKALWGEAPWETLIDFDGNEEVDLYIWQYHLQQMVISDDPIEYLGRNLDE